LSLKGHGEAIRFMKEFGLPMLVTGGVKGWKEGRISLSARGLFTHVKDSYGFSLNRVRPFRSFHLTE